MSSHVLDRSFNSRGPELGQLERPCAEVLIAPNFDLVGVRIHHQVLSKRISHLALKGVCVSAHKNGLGYVVGGSCLASCGEVHIVIRCELRALVSKDDANDGVGCCAAVAGNRARSLNKTKLPVQADLGR